jgi:hypothetical protein
MTFAMNASKTLDKDPPVSPIDENENSLFPSMTAVVVQDQEKGQYSSQTSVTHGSSSNENDFFGERTRGQLWHGAKESSWI